MPTAEKVGERETRRDPGSHRHPVYVTCAADRYSSVTAKSSASTAATNATAVTPDHVIRMLVRYQRSSASPQA